MSSGKGLIAGALVALAMIAPRVGGAASANDARNANVPGYKTHFQMPEYGSRQQWEERRANLRQQILSAAGLLPAPLKSPLHPKVMRRLVYQDYTIDVVLIETLPGYFLGGNVYRPAGKTT